MSGITRVTTNASRRGPKQKAQTGTVGGLYREAGDWATKLHRALPPVDWRTFHRSFREARIVREMVDWDGSITIFWEQGSFLALREGSYDEVWLHHGGQQFRQHSRDFEKEFCLPLGKRSQVLPVVDRTGLVVAYVMTVSAANVWILDETAFSWSSIEYGDRAEFWNETRPRTTIANFKNKEFFRGFGYRQFRENRGVGLDVLVNIEGEVQQILGERPITGHVESDGLGPLEYLAGLRVGIGVLKIISRSFIIKIGKQGFKKLISSIISRRQKIGDYLVARLRREHSKVGVNLGGAGEAGRNYVNVNKLIDGRDAASIPNLIKGDAADVANFFSPNSVDTVIAQNIIPGTFNWYRVAKGSFSVLKRNGTVRFAELAGGHSQGANIVQALKAAGFKDVKFDEIGKLMVEAVKP